MNKQKKLLLERGIFILIVFVLLGVIVITEKFGSIMIPQATKKIETYIENKYKELNLKENKVIFKNTTYTMKVESKENKNHYFYINYYNRKITDTYKKDYLEGKNLLTHIKKKLKKEINNKTNTNCDIEITSTLDKYTDLVKEKIIKEDNLLELKFFIIKKELIIDKWDEEIIANKINNFLDKFTGITPKSYTITITNQEDITESIEIKNITNKVSKEIISDIINNKKSDLLKENKITYKYLN